MLHRRHPAWIGLALVGLLAGCAGNGDGLQQNGQPTEPGSSSGGSSGGDPSGVTADFQSIQDNVFTPICSRCHIGASAPEGLQLDAAHSYNLLVGVPSVEQPTLERVSPGDPDHSYLVLKIEGAPGIDGGQMPLGETPLPQATIDAIRQWVADGAQKPQAASLARAVTMAAVSSFVVESSEPADRSRVSGAMRRIVVAFNHEVDASLVNGTTVALERIEADQAHSIAIGVALAKHNPAVLLVTPEQALEPGDYRLTLRGTGAAALADLEARTLGADLSIQFSVETE